MTVAAIPALGGYQEPDSLCTAAQALGVAKHRMRRGGARVAAQACAALTNIAAPERTDFKKATACADKQAGAFEGVWRQYSNRSAAVIKPP